MLVCTPISNPFGTPQIPCIHASGLLSPDRSEKTRPCIHRIGCKTAV